MHATNLLPDIVNSVNLLAIFGICRDSAGLLPASVAIQSTAPRYISISSSCLCEPCKRGWLCKIANQTWLRDTSYPCVGYGMCGTGIPLQLATKCLEFFFLWVIFSCLCCTAAGGKFLLASILFLLVEPPTTENCRKEFSYLLLVTNFKCV